MPERILVVEDDEDVAMITATFLRTSKYDVSIANDGPTALLMIEKELPDVMLLDIMMPHMSGLEVLRILRDKPETANLPVILVTAKARDDDVMRGYKHGADYYLTKPFTPAQLEYGIRMVLGQKSDATSRP